jgi:hypothetical protein
LIFCSCVEKEENIWTQEKGNICEFACVHAYVRERELHSEELHALYFSYNVKVIKSIRIGWVGCVT